MRPLKLHQVVGRGSQYNWKEGLRETNSLYKNYKRDRHQLGLNDLRLETIESSKLNHIQKVANKIADPKTSQKAILENL